MTTARRLMLASTGPLAAHGRRDPQARIYPRRNGEPRQLLPGGLPEPLPAMPYALVAADGRLFSGLVDVQLWESRDRRESWHSVVTRSTPSSPSATRRAGPPISPAARDRLLTDRWSC